MRKPLTIAGVCVLAVSAVMGLIAACMFTMTTVPPPWINAMGALCFWGFMPVSLVGVALLFVGLSRKPVRDSD